MSDGDFRTTFGDRVRLIREARGWTKAEASRHIGLSRSYLYQVERNQNSPSLAAIEVLAAGFELSVLELLAPLYGSLAENDAAWNKLMDAIQTQDDAWNATRSILVDIARQEIARRLIAKRLTGGKEQP